MCNQIIECYKLINCLPFQFTFHLLDCLTYFIGIKKFCEHIESELTKTMNFLTKKYAGIGPLIIMIERLVKGTNSGKAKCMADYYYHWERKVLDSLTNMLLR